jgi:2-methylcitrate dehydratase PrpD
MLQSGSSGGSFASDSDKNHTLTLASFVFETRWEDLPAEVRHEAVRAFINWLGCVYGGSRHPATRSALAGVAAISSSGPCTVLGHSVRLDPTGAALVNGVAASAYAWDDTHLSTIGHPTAPTAAALLAYAETHRLSGQDFLLSLILSNEVQARLSSALAVEPARCQIGFYMTGLTGAAGVAAGLARAMSLNIQQINWAIGIGATQGAGFRATHGTMCGAFVPADAGRNGLLAAHLAASNFTCHEDALCAPNGFLQVFASPSNPDALTQRLGEHFECMNVAAKPFPAGCLIHPVIEACLELTAGHTFLPDEVERIELQVNRLATGLTGRSEPRHAYDAQVSIYHWAAAVICSGNAGLKEASDACVHDPVVMEMRKRVKVVVADDLSADAARAAVVLRDGRTLQAAVDPCLGSAKRPMSDKQIEAKFLAQAEPVVGADRARELLAHIWDLPNAEHVGKSAPGFWG